MHRHVCNYKRSLSPKRRPSGIQYGGWIDIREDVLVIKLSREDDSLLKHSICRRLCENQSIDLITSDVGIRQIESC